jgi:hypothetical protein
MGIAGWIIAAVGAWGLVRPNGKSIRLAGEIPWMSSLTWRRISGIVVVLFGLGLVVASIVL